MTTFPPATAPICSISAVDRERVARVQATLPSVERLGALAERFRLLGDPRRVQILAALASEECCVCDLAHLLGVSSSAVSHQLRLLRQARLVAFRRAGKMVYYRLADESIRRLLDEGPLP